MLSSSTSIATVSSIQDLRRSAATGAQTSTVKSCNQEMVSKQKSVSMPCLITEQNGSPAPLIDFSFSMPPVNELTPSKYLYFLYIEAQEAKRSAAEACKKQKIGAEEQRAALDAKIKSFKTRLTKIKNRITEIKHIIEWQQILDEMKRSNDDLLSKINKVKSGNLEMLITLLNAAESQLRVENIAFPKTESELLTCQAHLAESLKTLSTYCQLKIDSKCDITKLADMVLEFQQLSVQVKQTVDRCSALEKELKDRTTEHNGKKCMLQAKQQYQERKR